MSEEKIIQFSKDQREPFEGDPVCVVCGKYGEYICDATDQDVCSIECKQVCLARAQKPITANTMDRNQEYYQWRIRMCYKYFVWGNYYSDKDIREVRSALNIVVKGENYHSLLSYSDIPLPDPFRSNISQLGIEIPTPIQMEAIPCIMSNRDVLLNSNTGSGKTLAYLLPLLLLHYEYFQAYDSYDDNLTLILVPSREIAIQIETVIRTVTTNVMGIRTALLIGGESRKQQLYRLASHCNLWIATPGRLLDYLQDEAVEVQNVMGLLENVRTVVFEECDILLKSDFLKQIDTILSHMDASSVEKIAVSATTTTRLVEQLTMWMHNPILIMIKDIEVLNTNLDYSFLWCENTQKKKKLLSLLKKSFIKTKYQHAPVYHFPLLIICSTKMETEDIKEILAATSLPITSQILTNETPFNERRVYLEQFQNGELHILISTFGIVGRGIEFDACNSLLLWSFATSISEFIHQVGRIGRKGSRGNVIIFCNGQNKKLFVKLKKLCGECHIKLPNQINEYIKEDELMNSKLPGSDLKRQNLFSKESTTEWKRFKGE